MGDDGPGRPSDNLGKLKDCSLVGIAQIEDVIVQCRRAPYLDQTVDQIGDVAQAASLGSVAVDGHRLARQRLGHKIWHEFARRADQSGVRSN